MAHSTAHSTTHTPATTKHSLSLTTITLTAGATAAAIAETTTVPFDVVKVRLQINTHTPHGMIHMASHILKQEGPTALFKGIQPALLRQVVYTSITMSLYKPIRHLLADNSIEDPGYLVKLAAGGIAGGIGIAIVNPVEVVKVGIQAQKSGSLSVASVVKSVHDAHGPRGFLKGLIPNVSRGIIVNAAELGTYDHCKHMLVQSGLVPEGSFLSHLGGSFAAGFAGALASNPVDVVKTRLMSQASTHLPSNGVPYAGVIDCVRRIVREEGLIALYKGFYPNWLRKGPWCMVFFLTYEQIQAKLKGLH